ncbi:hypothetical protein [Phyllobacterium phragmitis]|uniref:hypothetical protein n=1 Tax=Phyllobacterium phragmitis TaxID=2670329 RepID=UPI0038B244A7
MGETLIQRKRAKMPHEMMFAFLAVWDNVWFEHGRRTGRLNGARQNDMEAMPAIGRFLGE